MYGKTGVDNGPFTMSSTTRRDHPRGSICPILMSPIPRPIRGWVHGTPAMRQTSLLVYYVPITVRNPRPVSIQAMMMMTMVLRHLLIVRWPFVQPNDDVINPQCPIVEYNVQTIVC